MTTTTPPETKVIPVKQTPATFTAMLAGVQTKERAKAWGEKCGYSIVYYHARLQRAYGIKGSDGIAS